MQALINHALKQYQADLSRPLDISIPFSTEKGVNAYHAPPFSAEPVVMGSFIGSVEKGGPVNFVNVKVNPHGNGTHTECVGHITADPVTINQCLQEFFFIAEVISIYPEEMDNGDMVILREQVEKALTDRKAEAVILRTIPNDALKLKRNYSGKNPPYLHHGVAEFLVSCGVKHFLVDLPSVDREEDGGKLLFHKTFWQYPHHIRKDATITELIYVPPHVEDGIYLLNLQIASFELDASPSKPVLYSLV